MRLALHLHHSRPQPLLDRRSVIPDAPRGNPDEGDPSLGSELADRLRGEADEIGGLLGVHALIWLLHGFWFSCCFIGASDRPEPLYSRIKTPILPSYWGGKDYHLFLLTPVSARPSTTLGLLRAKLEVSRLQMATELEISEELVRNIECERTAASEAVGRRVSQRYMVSYEWIMRGTSESGFVVDIFDREWRTYNEGLIAANRDRYSWDESERPDVTPDSTYAKFLAWVTAAQILAFKVEKIEDFASITVTLPHHPDPSDSSLFESKTLTLAEALRTSFNSDLRPRLWDKEPLLALDCMLSGSDEFRALPLEEQVKALKAAIAHDNEKDTEHARHYLAQNRDDSSAQTSPPDDFSEDPHQRVWRRLNRAVSRVSPTDQ